MIGRFNFDADVLDDIGRMYIDSDFADAEIAKTVEYLLDAMYEVAENNSEELSAVGKALNKYSFKKIPKVSNVDAVLDAQLLSFLNGILYAEWVRTGFCDYEDFFLKDEERYSNAKVS